jgi:cell division septal protein FtsQ
MSRDRRTRPPRDINPRTTRRRSPADRIRRPTRRAPRPPRRLELQKYARAGARVAILALELVVVAVLVASPALAARQVTITGNKHLSRQQVLSGAGLAGRPSLLTLTTDSAMADLLANPYVRTVSVRTTLPDRVEVELQEWDPLVVVSRAGGFYVLNAEGTVLGVVASAAAGGPGQPRVAVTWDNKAILRTGQSALPGRLVVDLDTLHSSFPAAFGLTIASFSLDANQKLTANTAAGPRILFGQMATDEQIDSLDAKLASLKSLRTKVDLANSKLDYIDLENPGAVTTRGLPSPSPSAAPSPTKKP